MEIVKKKYRVCTADIKRLYRTNRRLIPKVPSYNENKSVQFSTDADYEDNIDEEIWNLDKLR